MLALRKTFKLCESSLLAGHRLADFQSKLVSRVRVSVKYLQQQIQSYDMNKSYDLNLKRHSFMRIR